LLEQLDCLSTIPRPTHHYYIPGLFQNGHDAIGYNRMVFRNENSNARPVQLFHFFECSFATCFINPSLEGAAALRKVSNDLWVAENPPRIEMID
jgi:hypothetical protein